jgi:hypothetical protein
MGLTTTARPRCTASAVDGDVAVSVTRSSSSRRKAGTYPRRRAGGPAAGHAEASVRPHGWPPGGAGSAGAGFGPSGRGSVRRGGAVDSGGHPPARRGSLPHRGTRFRRARFGRARGRGLACRRVFLTSLSLAPWPVSRSIARSGGELDGRRERAGVAQLAGQGAWTRAERPSGAEPRSTSATCRPSASCTIWCWRTSRSCENGACSRNGCTATSPPPAAGRVMTSSLRPSTAAIRHGAARAGSARRPG